MQDQSEAPTPAPAPKSSGSNKLLIVLVVVAAVFLLCGGLGIGIVMPAVMNARTIAYQTLDASNARMLTQGMLIYANDNGGQFPTHVGLLKQSGFADDKLLINPAYTDDLPDLTYTGQAPADNYTFGHYHFIHQPKGDNCPGDAIILFGRAHPDGNRAVAFGDGHSELFTTEHFTALIRERNAYRAQQGLSSINPNALGDLNASTPANPHQ